MQFCNPNPKLQDCMKSCANQHLKLEAAYNFPIYCISDEAKYLADETPFVEYEAYRLEDANKLLWICYALQEMSTIFI